MNPSPTATPYHLYVEHEVPGFEEEATYRDLADHYLAMKGALESCRMDKRLLKEYYHGSRSVWWERVF